MKARSDIFSNKRLKL